MTEQIYYYPSRGQALAAAIAWLEARGGSWGGHVEREIGRLGRLEGQEVGVWIPYNLRRLRLDYDADKGWHYNAQAFRGVRRQSAAFCFPQQERRGCEDCEDHRGATDCDTLLQQIEELTELVERGQRGGGGGGAEAAEGRRQELHQNKARLSNRLARYEARCAAHEAPNRQAIIDRGREVAAAPLPNFSVADPPEPGGSLCGCGCGCGILPGGSSMQRQRMIMGRPMLAL